jgi:hypothetical protein
MNRTWGSGLICAAYDASSGGRCELGDKSSCSIKGEEFSRSP